MSTSEVNAPYHHGDLQRALVEAGLQLLDEQGQGALGLREVARAVGVSASAPYRHFKNRAALLAAVAREGFLLFDAALAAAGEGRPDGERFRAMGEAYIRFALGNRALFRLMFSPDVRRDEHPDLRVAADAAFGSLAALAFKADPSAPRITALTAWSLVHGLAQLLLDAQINLRAGEDEEALIHAVVGRFSSTLGLR